MGPSGSGKSTLMQTIATLDTPDPNPATSIRIGGTELFGLKDNALPNSAANTSASSSSVQLGAHPHRGPEY